MCVFTWADWSHPPAVPGQAHSEAQEAVPVGPSRQLGRRQHQPDVGERLPERQGPQSRRRHRPALPNALADEPAVIPRPPPCHPKLKWYRRAKQHSATHWHGIQAGRQHSESDSQRHEFRRPQGRGQGGRQKRAPANDLTCACDGGGGGQCWSCPPCWFLLNSPKQKELKPAPLWTDSTRNCLRTPAE